MCVDRIKVLALLNSDFFEELGKKEHDELGKLCPPFIIIITVKKREIVNVYSALVRCAGRLAPPRACLARAVL